MSYSEFTKLSIERKDEMLKKSAKNTSNHVMVGSGKNAIFIKREQNSFDNLRREQERINQKIKRITRSRKK